MTEGIILMNCFLLIFNYVCNIFGNYMSRTSSSYYYGLLHISGYMQKKTVVLPYAFQTSILVYIHVDVLRNQLLLETYFELI